MTRALRWMSVICVFFCFGFEWPGRVERLSRQLRSENVAERREAARLLAEHQPEDAREALLMALDDDDASVRQEAILSAAKIGLRDHVPVLIDWLNDPAADTRATAAEALGIVREPRAEQPLIRALGDGDAKVRAAAATALGRIGGSDSVTPLLGRLDDADPAARLEAVKALGLMRDPRALVPLMARTQDAAMDVRAAVLAVLGSLGDPRALAPLLHSLDDDSEVGRLSAVAAIGNLKQASAIEPLRARLVGTDARMGRAVLAALAAIGTEAAEQLIIEQLGKGDLSRGATDVLVERVRRVRVLDPAAAARIIQALTTALQQTTDATRIAGLQATLIGCARYTSIAPAFDVLLSTFQEQRGMLATSARALALTQDERALMPLLERLDGATADDQLALVTALDALMTVLPADGRAADPLLAAVSRPGRPETLPMLAKILGLTRASRALPALVQLCTHTRVEVVLSAIEAIGAIGDAQSTTSLLPWMTDKRERVRDEATRALGRVLDDKAAITLLQGLGDVSDPERLARLEAITSALHRLRADNALPDASVDGLFAGLAPLATGEDETLAAHALDALGALGTQQAANHIASMLRAPSVSRRAQAARSLGAFDDPRVRHVLRFVMTHDHVDVTVAAAAALGRVGENDDARSMAKLTHRYHWPFPAAASYAIALLARRGQLKPIASQAMLCELAGSREPIVRANVAVAMAQLGLGACDNGPDPLQWLKPEHASQVRAAAARWVFAAANAGRMDRERGLRALSECAANDADAAVAEACAAPTLPALSASIRQVVRSPEGRVRLRQRLLALELADGSIFVGHSDDNGVLRAQPTPTDRATVTDPGLLALEPHAPAVKPAAPNADAASHPEAASPAPP